jgi:methylmalonyl-CoA/ethylmalonyl-CoA epimerase
MNQHLRIRDSLVEIGGHVKFHHVGLVVREIEKSMSDHQQRYGFAPLSPIVDDHVQQARVVLLDSGSNSLIELVEPFGSTSPLHKVLTRRAPLHHLCFEVASLDDSISHLRNEGLASISQPAPAPLFDGRRIAWLCDESSALIELLEAS